jgi:prephenate dehydrogenase
MWVEVFLQNRVELLSTLDAAESRLAELRGLISAGDRAGLTEYLAAARAFRQGLEGSRST